MEIKAYVCPQCGGSLEVQEKMTDVICPHCKTKLHISYADEGNGENRDPGVRQFATPEGLPLATAVVPPRYSMEGSISNQWQSEMVPFVTYIRAASPEQDIILGSASKELFYDMKNVVLKGMLGLIQTHVKSGYVSFLDPDAYLKRWAEQMAGTQLTAVAKTKLPSVFGSNPGLAKAQLQSDTGLYDTFWEIQFTHARELCESVLYQYTGKLNGEDIVVFAGADLEGAELVSSFGFGGGAMTGEIGNALSGIKDAVSKAFKGDGSGKGKMTMSDWMKGGLVGKMMRDKKAAEQAKAASAQTVAAAFGHSQKRVDVINYGSFRRYICIAKVEKKEEATDIFLRFAASIRPDSGLAKREADMLNQKMAALKQQAAMNQAIARQKQMQTIRMQQQTSQMIAQNSRQISDGLMDSWNKRQAAESRMSANYSEAIRGVDSYVTPMGSTVEMSVAADHVYQNQYGDTIGVSGSAIDPDITSKLNWTELEKN